ncbi:MAG: alpha/beta hydrolase [Chlorobiaceae bacterium]|nr:alpha/beta hydrolase [Chlorobiaceae bacterium]NTV16734.1 alpha/beta hydrolase [Chlorobiaceae bacterium]
MNSGKETAISLITALMLFLTGCSSTMLTSPVEPLRPPVQAFYATNRNDTGASNVSRKYGHERDIMTYGIAQITIPYDHHIGKFILSSFDREKRQQLEYLNLSVLSRDELLSRLSQAVAASEEKTLLIYVHGYNVTFNEAARGIGQIASDLDFKGCALFFSWPSQGHVSGYVDDEATILWAEKDLVKLLDDVAFHSGSKSIYLMGHSMGTRALTRAFLELIQNKPYQKTRFKSLILTAPDIDAETFKRDIGPALAASGARVTMYVSRKDKALKLSKRLHTFKRTGDSNEGAIIIPGIETVDASNVDTGVLGHSYHSDSRTVLSDIYYILNKDLKADERFSLQPLNISDGRYWKFKD